MSVALPLAHPSCWTLTFELQRIASTPSGRRRRRVTIDTHPHRSPSPSGSSSSADPLDEEHMPPKMRKKWIHRSSEALRAVSGSASPSGSVTSLGSTLGVGDGDKMEVDHVPPGKHSASTLVRTVLSSLWHCGLDAKVMPPPPLPAALDPTTISSIFPASIRKLAASPRPSDGPATPSPSTPFANLSLLSPIVPGPSQYFPSDSPSSFSPKLSTSFISGSSSSSGKVLQESSSASSGAVNSTTPMDVDGESSTKSLAVQPSAFAADPQDISLPLQSPSPEALDSCPPLQRREESRNISSAPLTAQLPHFPSPSPTSHPASLESDHTRVASLSPVPDADQIIAAPETPPPAPKVKMSLKDFALRKKKQREEEKAKTVTSPVDQPADRTLDMPLSNGVSDHDIMEAGRQEALGPASDSIFSGCSEATLVNGHGHLLRTSLEVHEHGSATMAQNGTLCLATVSGRTCTDPQVEMTSHMWDYGSPPASTAPESLKSEVELLEEPLSRDYLDSDPVLLRDVEMLPGTGACEDGARSMSLPSCAGTDCMTGRPNQEDGEIVAAALSRQPSSILARSHTPPTQPRSFSTNGVGHNTASPAAPSRRPSASSSYRPVPPPSRPVPSGPRALRVGMHGVPTAGPYPPGRPLSGSHYIPRGPSADRDRKDWDREWGWVGAQRGRGRGVSGSWGR